MMCVISKCVCIYMFIYIYLSLTCVAQGHPVGGMLRALKESIASMYVTYPNLVTTIINTI